MKHVNIRLSSIQDVRSFVDTVTGFEAEIDLASGRYIVDAKSIMGIFSLDLLHPIKLTVQSDDENTVDEILSALDAYIIK